MVDGRWIMRDGKLETIDEQQVAPEAGKIGHLVWRSLTRQFSNIPFPDTLPRQMPLRSEALPGKGQQEKCLPSPGRLAGQENGLHER